MTTLPKRDGVFLAQKAWVSLSCELGGVWRAPLTAETPILGSELERFSGSENPDIPVASAPARPRELAHHFLS